LFVLSLLSARCASRDVTPTLCTHRNDQKDWWDVAFDVVFLANVALTFCTPLEHHGSLLTDHWAIAKRYLKGWCVLARYPAPILAAFCAACWVCRLTSSESAGSFWTWRLRSRSTCSRSASACAPCA
jgi:hypothetical protein